MNIGTWIENRLIETGNSVTEIGTSGEVVFVFVFLLRAPYDQFYFILLNLRWQQELSKQVTEDNTTKFGGKDRKKYPAYWDKYPADREKVLLFLKFKILGINHNN